MSSSTPEHPLPLFLSKRADELDQQGVGQVWDRTSIPSRILKTTIAVLSATSIGIARDRGATGDGERIRFSSAILPLWARRTRSLDALLPVLYLRGISTGDFQEALTALLG